MLQMQVSLANVQEIERHNKATEAQGMIDLTRKQHEYEETVRHNKEQESISWESLAETKRSNRAQEAISWAEYGVHQANMVINRMNANTNARNAAVNEMNAITNRLQWMTADRRMRNDYSIGLANVQINQANANTNRLQALVAAQRLDIDTYRAKTDRMNARTNQFNSKVNFMNAETNRINSQVNVNRLSLDQRRFNWDASWDIVNFASGMLKSVAPSYESSAEYSTDTGSFQVVK